MKSMVFRRSSIYLLLQFKYIKTNILLIFSVEKFIFSSFLTIW